MCVCVCVCVCVCTCLKRVTHVVVSAANAKPTRAGRTIVEKRMMNDWYRR